MRTPTFITLAALLGTGKVYAMRNEPRTISASEPVWYTGCWQTTASPFKKANIIQAAKAFCPSIGSYMLGRDGNTHGQTIGVPSRGDYSVIFDVQWYQGNLASFALGEETCNAILEENLRACGSGDDIGKAGHLRWGQLDFNVDFVANPGARDTVV